jgi:hypothetical protein
MTVFARSVTGFGNTTICRYQSRYFSKGFFGVKLEVASCNCIQMF